MFCGSKYIFYNINIYSYRKFHSLSWSKFFFCYWRCSFSFSTFLPNSNGYHCQVFCTWIIFPQSHNNLVFFFQIRHFVRFIKIFFLALAITSLGLCVFCVFSHFLCFWVDQDVYLAVWVHKGSFLGFIPLIKINTYAFR